MVGKEDASADSRAPCQLSSGRKVFWRSASWSASRSAPHNPETEYKDGSDPNDGNGGGKYRQFHQPPPLTPRSQLNSKARLCLPPLQPLSIARRSLDEWPKAGSDDIGEWPQPPTPSGNKTGERLKLDLSSIHRNQDKSGRLVKRDKIAFFDKECSKVAEHIYLGGDSVARDRDILKRNRITHVLNCVGFVCPEYFKSDFVYRTLWLQDSPSEDITSILYDVFDYFEEVREQGGRVFVHCCQGVSRSTSLVIAYLMWRDGRSFDNAFQYVKAARGIADPNMGFACQLLQCQKRVHAFPLSPSSLLRMYRVAPHSPYDPLHLVPKLLNNPAPSALDSRGAFIIHIPSAIYIWIGKRCEALMERDARGAVHQIVRYERVQGAVVLVKEGAEPSQFWDAFSKILPLMDKSVNEVEVVKSTVMICPGERKVDSYNVDFEILQKAIRGGFIPPLASSITEQETHLPARESSWSVSRCKNASGNVKEFVSVPMISLSRVYSDSRMIVHSPASTLSPSSLSSSSSSPPYLSPDSVSSDSSGGSKSCSESSVDSPRAPSSKLVSSTLSNLSNKSLSSKKTCSSVSSGPDIRDANLTSNPCSLSAPSLCKRVSQSLAERRGSLSKSLRLPVMTDKMRVTSTLSSAVTSQEDADGINRINCSLGESDSIDKALKSKDGVKSSMGDSTEKRNLKMYASETSSIDSCQPDATSDGLKIKYNVGEDLGSSVRKGMGGSVSAELSQSNPIQPLVCCWPGLEKISAVARSNFDSEKAYAICPWSKAFGESENRIIFFWVGKSFGFDRRRIQLDDSSDPGNPEQIDWNQVSCNVRAQMGLPKETTVKIVKEDEEPEELLSLLNML